MGTEQSSTNYNCLSLMVLNPTTNLPWTCPFDDGLPHLSLVFLRRLSPQRGGRSLARPPLSLAERLQLLSCDLERARPARTAGAERGGVCSRRLRKPRHPAHLRVCGSFLLS